MAMSHLWPNPPLLAVSHLQAKPLLMAVSHLWPESQDAMLAAHLSEIRACPFYGMRVEYASETEGGASQPARNCQLAVALVRTTQRSRCVSTASGFLVSTAGVRDASRQV